MDEPEEESEAPAYTGPLHLQGFLANCQGPLADTMRKAVSHRIGVIQALVCDCQPSGIVRVIKDAEKSEDPSERRKASARREALEKHQQERRSTVMLPTAGRASRDSDRRIACRLFSVEVNEEDGLIRAFCRRCNRMLLVFDRDLYWGTHRSAATPKSYPYRSACGGHTFEVAMGFDYPDDAMDENDINILTVAVKCAASEEIAIILDEEAS